MWLFCEDHPRVGEFRQDGKIHKLHSSHNIKPYTPKNAAQLKEKMHLRDPAGTGINSIGPTVTGAILETNPAFRSVEDLKKSMREARLGHAEEDRPLDYYADNLQREGEKPEKPEFHLVAKALMDRNAFKRIGLKDPLLIRKNRTYVEEAEKYILDEIGDALPQTPQSFRKEVIKHIGDINGAERADFDSDPLLINCKNTFLNLTTLEPVQDKGQLSRMQIDTDFKPELGRSELFENGLKEAIPQHSELFLEFVGSILLRQAVTLGKYLINVGDGRRGKSTNVTAVRKTIGTEKFSDVELIPLENNKFKVASLDGKWGNIATDMKAGRITDPANIRKLTFYEPVDAERKGLDNFSLIFTGKIILTCNSLPEMSVFAESDMNRVILIPWVGQEHELNEDYKKQFETPEEQSRILNTLLYYAQKVLSAGSLSKEQTAEEVRELWKTNSDLVNLFIDEQITDDDKDVLFGYEAVNNPTLQAVYSEYIKFVHSKGKPPQSMQKFNQKLTDQGYDKGRRKDGRIWNNLTLYRKEEAEPGQTTLPDTK